MPEKGDLDRVKLSPPPARPLSEEGRDEPKQKQANAQQINEPSRH